jgi:GTP diphosphokinase / guanosine-3',5'-bis(diphosphate) 3'-diphosphatase
LERHKVEYSDKLLAKAAPRLGHKNGDDALSAVGKGELSAVDVLKAMGVSVDEADLKLARRKVSSKKSSELSIPVRGAAAGSVLKIHTRTGAVPGERIVGIVTPGEGIMIYPIFADALEKFDTQPERWLDLAWGNAEEGQRFPARIKLILQNEVGALAHVTQAIGDKGGNIDGLNLQAKEGVRDFFELEILLEVSDVRHLNEIMTEIKNKPSVNQVTRVTG